MDSGDLTRSRRAVSGRSTRRSVSIGARPVSTVTASTDVPAHEDSYQERPATGQFPRRQSEARSTVSAAVHENSGAPCRAPVTGEKYSAKPLLVDQVERAAAQVVGEIGASPAAEAFDDRPVGVHPGGPLPVAVLVEVGRIERARSAPGTRASRRPGSGAAPRARRACTCRRAAGGRRRWSVRSAARGSLRTREQYSRSARARAARARPRARSFDRREVAEVAGRVRQRVVGGGEERVERRRPR